MFKAVIFDMDGVIIDSEPVHNIVTRKIIENLGIELSETEIDSFVGASNEIIFAKLKKQYNLTAPVHDIVDSYNRYYTDILVTSSNFKPIHGVTELIKSIHDKGLKIALASSSIEAHIRLVIGSFQIEPYFNCVINGRMVEKSKPSPDIFLRAAQCLGVNPAECIVIEDSSNGVRAAKAAGMSCVGFRNPNSGMQDISSADLIINRFDTANIDNIIDELTEAAQRSLS